MKKNSYKLLFLAFFLFSFNSLKAQWSTEHLSLARRWMGAVTVGSKVYFAGGYTHENPCVMSKRIDIYYNPSDTWTRASLRSARGDLACIYYNNKICIAGDTTYGYCSSKVVDIYITLTSTWSVDSLQAA